MPRLLPSDDARIQPPDFTMAIPSEEDVEISGFIEISQNEGC